MPYSRFIWDSSAIFEWNLILTRSDLSIYPKLLLDFLKMIPGNCCRIIPFNTEAALKHFVKYKDFYIRFFFLFLPMQNQAHKGL